MADETEGLGLAGRSSVEQVQAEQQELGPKQDGGQAQAEVRAEPVLKEWLGLLLRAACWALLIYQFVFQVSVVKGFSMEPNFHDDDRLLIDKLAFRFRDPQPGEAVVFEAVVQDPDTGKHVPRDFIKRVLAGPGDEVKIFDGKVHVNGRALEEAWAPKEFGGADSWHGKDAALTYVLPPERYFVLGDNREAGKSEDSREGKIGYVHRRQIKGKVRWRFYPFGRAQWY